MAPTLRKRSESTPSKVPLYKLNDKVLCKFNGQLYDALILEIKRVDLFQKERKEDKKSNTEEADSETEDEAPTIRSMAEDNEEGCADMYAYFLHYKQWNRNWDEWVRSDCLTPISEESRNEQKKLKMDARKEKMKKNIKRKRRRRRRKTVLSQSQNSEQSQSQNSEDEETEPETDNNMDDYESDSQSQPGTPTKRRGRDENCVANLTKLNRLLMPILSRESLHGSNELEDNERENLGFANQDRMDQPKNVEESENIYQIGMAKLDELAIDDNETVVLTPSRMLNKSEGMEIDDNEKSRNAPGESTEDKMDTEDNEDLAGKQAMDEPMESEAIGAKNLTVNQDAIQSKESEDGKDEKAFMANHDGLEHSKYLEDAEVDDRILVPSHNDHADVNATCSSKNVDQNGLTVENDKKMEIVAEMKTVENEDSNLNNERSLIAAIDDPTVSDVLAELRDHMSSVEGIGFTLGTAFVKQIGLFFESKYQLILPSTTREMVSQVIRERGVAKVGSVVYYTALCRLIDLLESGGWGAHQMLPAIQRSTDEMEDLQIILETCQPYFDVMKRFLSSKASSIKSLKGN